MQKSIIRLATQLSDKSMERYVRKVVDPETVTTLLTGDADVYKPNGELLFALRKKVFTETLMEHAYPALHELRNYKTTNRGVYSGKERPQVLKADGSVSKSSATRDSQGKTVSVASASVGYFERQGGHNPSCRALSFTANQVEKWRTILPMVELASALYAGNFPTYYGRQLAFARGARPEYVIGNTPFSTLTVNNNTCAAVHKDAGDYKDGFGLISVLRQGTYDGCWLAFPQYAIAADLGHGDLLFFNPHDWHGNTPYRNEVEGYERISIVYYFREKIRQCLEHSEEIANARRARGKIA